MKRQGGRPTPEWLLVPGVIERLSAMWAAGDSYNEIALALGVTKGAIAGKIDRLELDPRPRAKSDRDHPRPPHRYEGQPRTLPPLASEPVAPRPVVAAPIPIARPIAAPRPMFTRAVECCWPSGEPGTKSFRFCEGPALPGKPYCDEHAKRAFVKVRDRKDDAGQRTAADGSRLMEVRCCVPDCPGEWWACAPGTEAEERIQGNVCVLAPAAEIPLLAWCMEHWPASRQQAAHESMGG